MKKESIASNGRIARSGSLATIVASLLSGSSAQTVTISTSNDASQSAVMLQEMKNMTVIQNIYYINITGDLNISD